MTGFAAYDEVAQEYYDQKRHPTSANFNYLSRAFIKSAFAGTSIATPALEVGAGKSTLAPLMKAKNQNLSDLTLVDGSPLMLEHSREWREMGAKLKVMDAEDLRFTSKKYGTIVAGLADPFNTPAFWSGVARVLRRNGTAVITIPSYEWATAFRQRKSESGPDYAVFELPNQRFVKMRSLICPLPDQISMIHNAGLGPVEFRAYTAADLPARMGLSKKLAVFRGRHGPLIWGFICRRS